MVIYIAKGSSIVPMESLVRNLEKSEIISKNTLFSEDEYPMRVI